MRIHKIAVIAAFALASVPAAAFAAHPATPANSHANSKANGTSTTGTSSMAQPNSHASTAQANSHASTAKVMFVLRGTLTAYTAAAGTTNGSVSIMVASSNRHASSLKGATLTFPVSSSTKIAGTFKAGDKGIVKVRAAKNTSSATLQTLTAFQVIDQGSSSSS